MVTGDIQHIETKKVTNNFINGQGMPISGISGTLFWYYKSMSLKHYLPTFIIDQR